MGVCSKRVVSEEGASWKRAEWIEIKETQRRNIIIIEREVVWAGNVTKEIEK